MSEPLSPATPISAALQSPTNSPPPPPPRHGVRCPRCASTNTKFCYYNNYSMSQPRHYCKSCRRYWTQGGSLRNIPIGGATSCRKNKKPRISSPEDTIGGGGGGFFMIPQAPPQIDHFQLAGNLYPPNLSPFGDHLVNFRAPPPATGPSMDLLEGLNFNSPLINNSGGGLIEYSLVNYSLNHHQQQQRMAVLYGGVGGGDGGEIIGQMNNILSSNNNNKDKNYQKAEEEENGSGFVGPTEEGMNLFGKKNLEEEVITKGHYVDDDDDESPENSVSTQWLFGEGSSSRGIIGKNKSINNVERSGDDGNATNNSLKRWTSW